MEKEGEIQGKSRESQGETYGGWNNGIYEDWRLKMLIFDGKTWDLIVEHEWILRLKDGIEPENVVI